MGTKRIIKRRSLRSTDIRRSTKATEKDSWIYKLEGLRFPRRAFLTGVGIAAVAGLVIGTWYNYEKNYAHKTWRPGKETWKPTVYAPQEEMDPVDKAIWLIKENLCRYSIDDLKKMNLQPDEVYYMLTYQLRAKQITEEHLRFYLQALETEKLPYTNEKKVFFPLPLQGHICQFLDTLFRSGVRSDTDFKVKGQTRSLWDILLNEINDFPPERMGITNEDPSWIISAYVGANPPPELLTPSGWRFGTGLDILPYITYAFEKNPDTGRARCLDFACLGLHFPDALSQLYWYCGQHLDKYKEIRNLQEITLKTIRKLPPMNESLKHFSNDLIPSIEKFREEPTKENYSEAFNAVVYLVHALELILEPQGYYRYNFPLTELEPVVKNLSEGVALWYSPDMDSQRKLIDTWEHYNDSEYLKKLKWMSPAERKELEKIQQQLGRYTSMTYGGRCSVFMNARLLQGCNGLMLWQQYKKQQAQKAVEPTPH